jgi:hypothetical protein
MKSKPKHKQRQRIKPKHKPKRTKTKTRDKRQRHRWHPLFFELFTSDRHAKSLKSGNVAPSLSRFPCSVGVKNRFENSILIRSIFPKRIRRLEGDRAHTMLQRVEFFLMGGGSANKDFLWLFHFCATQEAWKET